MLSQALDVLQISEHLAQVERARVDGVVRPRIRDVAVRVQVLGDAGRPRRAEPQACRCCQECRCVERGRRVAGRGLLLDLLDRRGVRDVLVRALCPRLIPEALGLVADGEGVAVLEVYLELPVGIGDEGAAFAFAFRYKDQGWGLDASHRQERAAVTFRGAGDPAGQGGAPDQVYILPRLAGVGQVVGNLQQLVEGASDLPWRKRRKAGALNVIRQLRVRFEDPG